MCWSIQRLVISAIAWLRHPTKLLGTIPSEPERRIKAACTRPRHPAYNFNVASILKECARTHIRARCSSRCTVFYRNDVVARALVFSLAVLFYSTMTTALVAQTFKVMHTFEGGNTDGANPQAML